MLTVAVMVWKNIDESCGYDSTASAIFSWLYRISKQVSLHTKSIHLQPSKCFSERVKVEGNMITFFPVGFVLASYSTNPVDASYFQEPFMITYSTNWY